MNGTLTLHDIPRVKAGMAAATETDSGEGIDRERAYLAARTKELLGYSVLAADVSGAKTVGVVEGKLTQTLLQLEINVLDTAKVIEYQMDEASRRTSELIHERFKDWVMGYFYPAAWTHTAISAYKRPVPEFALHKAVKIKEALPNVGFYIQHLNDPKADPFLVAVLDDEIYYVDAWDEPRFEATL